MVLQLPGVDPNDPSVKDLLASMQSQSEVSLLIYIYIYISIFPANVNNTTMPRINFFFYCIKITSFRVTRRKTKTKNQKKMTNDHSELFFHARFDIKNPLTHLTSFLV